MKKSTLVLTGLVVTVISASAALAAPKPEEHRAPNSAAHAKPAPKAAPHAQKEELRRIPETAPEEIKNAYKEMRSLRKDLRLELNKDNPDAAKAMEMLNKSEEYHVKVRQWEVQQILDGNAPKPDLAPRHRVPAGAPSAPSNGAPEAPKADAPKPEGPAQFAPRPADGPVPPAPCGRAPRPGFHRRPCMMPPFAQPAPEGFAPAPVPAPQNAPAPAPQPAPQAPAPQPEAQNGPAPEPAPQSAPMAGPVPQPSK